jgi:hypothetical protein
MMLAVAACCSEAVAIWDMTLSILSMEHTITHLFHGCGDLLHAGLQEILAPGLVAPHAIQLLLGRYITPAGHVADHLGRIETVPDRKSGAQSCR